MDGGQSLLVNTLFDGRRRGPGLPQSQYAPQLRGRVGPLRGIGRAGGLGTIPAALYGSVSGRDPRDG